MSRAFTMIELLVVMAIMAMLGVAATGGYAALQRGMRERAAVAAATALLRSAKERAAVDRVPTAVFCYNRLLRDTSADADENAIVVGVMTAIRRAGRLSFVSGEFLYDEFGDLEHPGNFEVLSDDGEFSGDGQAHVPGDLKNRSGMRLWRFPTSETMEYSIVADAVWIDTMRFETLFSGGAAGNSTNCLMGAFYNLGKSKHEASWATGDAYAFEIGEIQLPHGFIFGTQIPTEVGTIAQVDAILFDSEQDQDRSVEVYMTKPSSSGMPVKDKLAGRATTSESENL